MNPFIAIYNFIKTKLFAKYPVLGACYMYDDEEDSRYKEYYIKYKGNLSFEEMKKIYKSIIEDICDFCHKNGYEDALKHSSILIGRLV